MSPKAFLVVLILFVYHLIPAIVSLIFAEGRIEHHKIHSKILAEADEIAERELSIVQDLFPLRFRVYVDN